MSQFQPALSFVLDNEDRLREYEAVPDAPVGAHAISGINSAAYPEQYAKVAAIPQSERGPAVSDFYESEFWNPLGAAGIASQDLANRVLDQAVNGGLKTGGMLLQTAANACGATLLIDGSIGPNTLSVVNSLDPDKLLVAFKQARVNHYNRVAARSVELRQYLKNWLTRASK